MDDALTNMGGVMTRESASEANERLRKFTSREFCVRKNFVPTSRF
jgi:hypothetical protein